LTREHMDYHKTFEGYFAAKRRLFEGTGAGAPEVAVLNTDDSYGKQLGGLAKNTVTYGLESDADITAKKFHLSFEGLHFTARTPNGTMEVTSRLVGRINVRSEEHTSELQSLAYLVCRLLLEKKNKSIDFRL